MLVLGAFELLLITFVIIFIVTQMFIPSIRGTVMFPYFRKEQKLISKLKEINQESVEIDLENVVKESENQNFKKRSS